MTLNMHYALFLGSKTKEMDKIPGTAKQPFVHLTRLDVKKGEVSHHKIIFGHQALVTFQVIHTFVAIYFSSSEA